MKTLPKRKRTARMRSKDDLTKFLLACDAFEAMSRKSKFRAKAAVAYFAVLLFAVAAYAADVKLAWDAPPERVTHYEVMWRTNTTYTNFSVSMLTTTTLPGLKSGTRYYFAVKAVNASLGFGMISRPSTELAYTVPAAASYRDVVTLEGRRYSGQPWLALSTNSFTIPTNQSYRLNIQRIKQ